MWLKNEHTKPQSTSSFTLYQGLCKLDVMSVCATATSSWFLVVYKLTCSLEPSEVLIAWPTAIASLLVVQLITSPCVISISCQCHHTAVKSGSESFFTATAHTWQERKLSNSIFQCVLSLVLHHLTGHTSKVFGPFFRA